MSGEEGFEVSRELFSPESVLADDTLVDALVEYLDASEDDSNEKKIEMDLKIMNDLLISRPFQSAELSFIGSLDSGTSSTRFMIFDKAGALVSSHQKEHTQYFPAPGLVEHDCLQIWDSVQDTMKNAMAKVQLKASDIKAIGITNQRETTVLWNRHTGIPYHKAIVWNDTRTANICTRYEDMEGVTAKIQDITGLPLATYFSATKIIYLLETIPDIKKEIEENNVLFGTIDSFLIWKLTSGQNHVTDVTNASRTMLMNLQTLQYDDELLSLFRIPKSILPKITSSSHPTDFGIISSTDIPIMAGVRITGVLGDQQAALFGQGCFEIGDAKCTYGTGAFVLLNTGTNAICSAHGLITTVGYQLHTSPPSPPVFALEGAVAYCGATIQWLRDNLKVPDSGGVYFVPAFSGLFAPYWRRDARAVIIGLSAFHTSAHIARAALEAAAFQTYEVMEVMRRDSQLDIRMLRVDGGMTQNGLLMQFQSDILNELLHVPRHPETTALGAALIAGLGANYFSGLEEVLEIAHSDSGEEWRPNMSTEKRADLVKKLQ